MKLTHLLFQDDLRNDGRTRRDFRPIDLETNVIASACGSARLCLGNSDIIVGIKPEIDSPRPDEPEEGKLEFSVDCSANSMLDFEGRGGEELASEIANCLRESYASSQAFDLKSLCILPKHQCWKLYVDILILQCSGNLYDAISLAVKCAMYDLKIPRVSSAILDGGNVDLMLSDDPSDCDRLNVDSVPVLMTLARIGDACVVDPSIDEEICSTASLVVAVSGQHITFVKSISGGSLHTDTFDTCIDLAIDSSSILNENLLKALKQDEQQRKMTHRENHSSFLD